MIRSAVLHFLFAQIIANFELQNITDFKIPIINIKLFCPYPHSKPTGSICNSCPFHSILLSAFRQFQNDPNFTSLRLLINPIFTAYFTIFPIHAFFLYILVSSLPNFPFHIVPYYRSLKYILKLSGK